MWWPLTRFAACAQGLRPVTGPRPDMRGQLPGGDRPAARALLRLRHVLGNLRRRLDVGDLVTALRRDRRPGQARAASAARRRRAVDGLIRVIHQAHRRPGVAWLLSRPPFPALAQRTVAAFLLVRAIGGRGTRGRGRVLAGPAAPAAPPPAPRAPRPGWSVLPPVRSARRSAGTPLPAAPPAQRPAEQTAPPQREH